MDFFSDESKLLLRHWDTIEQILFAERRLRTECAEILSKFEGVLKSEPWWSDSWVFERHDYAQIYISRREWFVKDNYYVWIGMEQFVPERIFGSESSPYLYVWVPKEYQRLVIPISKMLEENFDTIEGNFDTKANGFIVREPLVKCLPEQLEDFNIIILERIKKFFRFYAECGDQIASIINVTL